MTQRRPHWDDNLLDAVNDVLYEFARGEYSREHIFAVIAAVEDWVLSQPIFALHVSRRAARAEARIQAVRDVCNDATMRITRVMDDPGPQDRVVFVNDVLRALDGAS